MDIEDEDTFKILISTDNHLGYGGENPVLENDSFTTFEEILNIAVKENVDFILLGGDLFHEARPTPYCINKCIELIKKYCLGDKCVEIEVLSDPSLHFHRSGMVNYEDPNMNIAIPVFSIHGNHDDPTGKRQISAMDLMASTGLVNYFGRWDDVTQVEINPVLLKKGRSQLALYGLSHIRDERLCRLFEKNNVIIKTPPSVDSWFNLMVLHQNRANRGVKNFIPETCVPKFMNLVMWGHEHDCRIEPTLMKNNQTYVTQPGSSVATSLSEGEAIQKKVGLLRINEKNFNITPIPLLTVRPFVYKIITLEPFTKIFGKTSHADKAKQKVRDEIERLIVEANSLGRINNMRPLIRLVVKYLDEKQVFNAIRFGQEFSEKIANPEDVVKFVGLVKKKRIKLSADGMELDDEEEVDNEQTERVEDLIPEFLVEGNALKILSMKGLNEAVRKYIDSNDADAPASMLKNQEEFLLNKLLELKPNEDDVEFCLEGLQSQRNDDDYKNVLNDPNRPKPSTSFISDNDDIVTIDESDDNSGNTSVVSTKPARGSRSRGGRGSRGGKGSRGPRGGRAK